jgi:L-fuculose-phosphate aldolase
MHLACYRARPDVNAIVHAHPPFAVALSLCGVEIASEALPEVLVMLGVVRTVPFVRAGTAELARNVASASAGCDALILARHGAVTLGKTINEALNKMETLEWASQVTVITQMIGECSHS